MVLIGMCLSRNVYSLSNAMLLFQNPETVYVTFLVAYEDNAFKIDKVADELMKQKKAALWYHPDPYWPFSMVAFATEFPEWNNTFPRSTVYPNKGFNMARLRVAVLARLPHIRDLQAKRDRLTLDKRRPNDIRPPIQRADSGSKAASNQSINKPKSSIAGRDASESGPGASTHAESDDVEIQDMDFDAPTITDEPAQIESSQEKLEHQLQTSSGDFIRDEHGVVRSRTITDPRLRGRVSSLPKTNGETESVSNATAKQAATAKAPIVPEPVTSPAIEEPGERVETQATPQPLNADTPPAISSKNQAQTNPDSTLAALAKLNGLQLDRALNENLGLTFREIITDLATKQLPPPHVVYINMPPSLSTDCEIIKRWIYENRGIPFTNKYDEDWDRYISLATAGGVYLVCCKPRHLLLFIEKTDNMKVSPEFEEFRKIPKFREVLKSPVNIFRICLKAPIRKALSGSDHLQQLFPYGRCILLTESFLRYNPDSVLHFLGWYETKVIGVREPGTWKVHLRPDVRHWLFAMSKRSKDER